VTAATDASFVSNTTGKQRTVDCNRIRGQNNSQHSPSLLLKSPRFNMSKLSAKERERLRKMAKKPDNTIGLSTSRKSLNFPQTQRSASSTVP